MNKTDGPEKDKHIRIRIEEVLKKRSLDKLLADEHNFDQLLQEVSIYHQELEYQNMELQRIQNELQESETHFRILFNEAPAGYVLADENFRLVRANRVFLQMTEKEEGDIKNGLLRDLIHPDFQDEYYFFCRRITLGDAIQEETVLALSPGSEKAVMTKLRARSIEYKQTKHWLFSFTDISGEQKALKVLAESEKNYRLLFENIAQGFTLNEAIFDEKGHMSDARFLKANPAFFSLTGLQPEAVLGKTLLGVLPDTEAYWLEIYEQVVKTGKPVRYENYAAAFDRHFLVWVFSPQPGQFGVITSDITQNRKNAMLQRAMHQVAHEVVTAANFEELFSVVRRELAPLIDTRNFIIALYEPDSDQFYSPFKIDSETSTPDSWPAADSLSGLVLHQEKSMLLNRSQIEDLAREGRIIPRGGRAACWMGVPLMAESKKIGVMILQHYERSDAFGSEDLKLLETIASQLSVYVLRKLNEIELIAAKEKAEESDRLKVAFLNNMSHEIRTPMNGIMGFTNLLSRPGLTDQERNYFIRIINQSSQQLLSIIDDIINISTIEAGQEKLREEIADIPQLFDQLYHQFKDHVQGEKVLLNYQSHLKPEESRVLVDATKLMQIMSNLIGNAIKFTERGRIEFHCRKKGDRLEFRVSDTGIGIAAEFHQLIFERFRQVQPGGNKLAEGNGLGLPISKAYVELMGGSFRLDSEPGRGSVFSFDIPYKAVPSSDEITASNGPVLTELHESAHETVPGSQPGQQKPLILIAEDEFSNYLLLEALLEPTGAQLVHVTNGRDAVDKLHEGLTPDLVLMDLKMPVMDGLEASRILRKDFPELPIIAITAYALMGDREKALEAGCNEYLAKPLRRSDFMELIGRFLPGRL